MVHFGLQKLSLREVDDLWIGADDGFNVFPFDLFSFPESALKVLYLFLHTKKPGRVRNQGRTIRRTDAHPHPEPRYLIPLNRVLALSNDRRLFVYRAPLGFPLALCRIIRQGR